MPTPITHNTLFYGDNLAILREYIADQSIDLVYLDPPFNAARNFNVLFRDEQGVASEAQIQAFIDTWKWSVEAEATYHELIMRGDELHRVLKPTRSLYLHCDPTASHVKSLW